MTAQATIILAR